MMAEYSPYYQQGQGGQDPNNPNPTQPAPQQFSPGMAQQQGQFYQQGSPYSPQPPGQPYYGGQQPMGQPPMGQPMGYGAPQQPPPPGDDGGLAQQMGGMSLQGEVHHTARRKKKDRHAYHQMEAPAAPSAGFGGMGGMGGMPPAPGPAPGAPADFFHQQGSGAGPQILSPGMGMGGVSPGMSPQMNQFPAGVGAGFSPVPASPAEFGARNGMDTMSSSAVVPNSGPGSTVSAEDLPSVPAMRDSIQQYYQKNQYPTFEKHVPPPASISFKAFDQGNASPKFARLTMNSIPASSEGLTTTGLPLGLVLQPLARLNPGELPIPVLDFGENGPPRCRRCRAYINPFMMFRSGGNRFVCNLCTHPNETPSEYFCATTPAGVRVDRDQRPELTRGTVEFVVPKEYWTKEPVGLRWLFLIDVSQEAFNKGYLEAFCQGILKTLYADDDDEEKKEEGEEGEDAEPKRTIPPNSKVGFVTFDKDIQFYNVNVSAP